MRRRRSGGAFLSCFYMLFVYGRAIGFDAQWPMIAFFTPMLNRLFPALDGAVPSAATKSYLVSRRVMRTLAYVGRRAVAWCAQRYVDARRRIAWCRHDDC